MQIDRLRSKQYYSSQHQAIPVKLTKSCGSAGVRSPDEEQTRWQIPLKMDTQLGKKVDL